MASASASAADRGRTITRIVDRAVLVELQEIAPSIWRPPTRASKTTACRWRAPPISRTKLRLEDDRTAESEVFRELGDSCVRVACFEGGGEWDARLDLLIKSTIRDGCR
jgi:hypothetical protein